ncbi:XRE family transcriptional regulator [Psychromonas sp. PRT-SC03]|nr:XRE family transcriptional regulator [Psychromonas sp. PRT-SC03]
MDDLDKYIASKKKDNVSFAKGFDAEYGVFKANVIGELIKESRKKAGMTQAQLAKKMKTKASAISRIENHAEDMKVSTLLRAASALNLSLHISIS